MKIVGRGDEIELVETFVREAADRARTIRRARGGQVRAVA
jgi:hypothetical protein